MEMLNERNASVSGQVAGIRIESAGDASGTTMLSIETREGKSYGFPLSERETRALCGLLFASAECGKVDK